MREVYEFVNQKAPLRGRNAFMSYLILLKEDLPYPYNTELQSKSISASNSAHVCLTKVHPAYYSIGCNKETKVVAVVAIVVEVFLESLSNTKQSQLAKLL